MNPLAVAMQGLGFAAALVALQGLLAFVVAEVIKHEALHGGGIKTRRRVVRAPLVMPWPLKPEDEDEALLMALGAL